MREILHSGINITQNGDGDYIVNLDAPLVTIKGKTYHSLEEYLKDVHDNVYNVLAKLIKESQELSGELNNPMPDYSSFFGINSLPGLNSLNTEHPAYLEAMSSSNGGSSGVAQRNYPQAKNSSIVTTGGGANSDNTIAQVIQAGKASAKFNSLLNTDNITIDNYSNYITPGDETGTDPDSPHNIQFKSSGDLEYDVLLLTHELTNKANSTTLDNLKKKLQDGAIKPWEYGDALLNIEAKGVINQYIVLAQLNPATDQIKELAAKLDINPDELAGVITMLQSGGYNERTLLKERRDRWEMPPLLKQGRMLE